jgi:hypothetical protein
LWAGGTKEQGQERREASLDLGDCHLLPKPMIGIAQMAGSGTALPMESLLSLERRRR